MFCAQLCEFHGHTVACMANLCPPLSKEEELDSHCFQTIAHGVVNLYSQLRAGTPVFRRRILGRSKLTELQYPEEKDNDERVIGDEVEDLRSLLAFVKREMPDVNAVSSGQFSAF